MAGATNASHGNMPRSMEAGTEYTHSSGRATSAGARQTAIRMSTISAVAPTDTQIRKDSSTLAGAGETVVRIWLQAPVSRSPASVTTAALGMTPPIPPVVKSAVSATAAPANCRSTVSAAGTRASRAPTPTSQITRTTSTTCQNQSVPLIIGGIASVAAITATAPISVGHR